MAAVDAELTVGGAGGPLAAESLANVLAVHLIRHVLAPRRLGRGPDGALPRAKLRAVLEYIEEHLDASPTLEQMAAVARLSPFHFAASNVPSSSCKPAATSPWRKSPRKPASRTRASSPVTSSVSSASRRGSSGCPQESANGPQAPPRNEKATRLPFC
jgi:hypothetical protein